MRKKLSILLIIVLISSFMLTGCNGASKENDIEEDVEVGKEDNGDYTPDKITVGCGQSGEPIVWVDGDEVKGHEADLWEAFSELTGVEVEMVPAEFSALFGYLDSGKIDTVANQITLNQTRIDKYNFVEPYAYMPEKIMVPKGSNMKKIKELDGMDVGYSNGSNGKNLFEQIEKDYDIELNITAYEGDALIQALSTGKIMGVIVPGAPYAYKFKNGILDFEFIEESIVYGAKGYPFRKNDEEAEKKRKFVEEAFEELRENGTLKELSEKWYDEDFTNLPNGVEVAN